MRTTVLSLIASLCVLSAGQAHAQDAAEAPLAAPQLSPIEAGNAPDMTEETAIETEAPVELVDLAPLSDTDVSLYREIFDLQRDGNWDKADRLIKKLDNDILMGHVLYERYMHPTAYTSRYRELADWMLKYPDHPGAKRIYDLAVKKMEAKTGGCINLCRCWQLHFRPTNR